MIQEDGADSRFTPLTACWICGSDQLVRIHQGRFDLAPYAEQDPDLSSYTGYKLWLKRCRGCGFAQPEALPTLPNYFARMYDQRWSEEWVQQEFDSGCKDFIFYTVLGELAGRVPPSQRRLLDVGAHVGRLIYLAQQSGWQAEGIEINQPTSAYAARKTQLPVHQVNAESLALERVEYGAVTLIDVLEHIPNPLKLLCTIGKLLEPNGWVAIKVPCGRNQLFKEYVRSRLHKNYKVSVADNLVHVNHFSPSSLRIALEKAGFSQVTITLGAPELSPLETSRSARKLLSSTLRLSVYHLGRFIPGGIHSPLAFNLQAYAQKNLERGGLREPAN